jgi:acyl-coenzyme A thioesterase PaaI-like protein
LHLGDASRRALRQSGGDHAGGLPRRVRRLVHGRAAAVTYAEGRRVFCSNAEIKISFLGAVPPGADLTCNAEVVSGGRRVAFVEASVTARMDGQEEERLVARASSTYLYKDRD